jgi:Cytochrome c554 and c-prime
MTNTAGVRGKAITPGDGKRSKGEKEPSGSKAFAPLLLFTLSPLLLAAGLTAHAAETPAPKFLGAQSCANSMCHGGAGDKRDQFVTWSKKDFHTRAPATLSMSRSTRIAETLKIADATTSARCTECHNPFQAVPAERKGPLVGKLEGVSCESCHNAAENWLLTHTRPDLNHAQKVAAGMRDLKNLYVRANTCVACHQNLDPELRAAGHPELTFELDGQCVAMPRHWTETNRLRGAQAWFVGQAVAAREAAAQSAEVKAGEDVRQRTAALSALLSIAPEPRAADELAREAAGLNWNESEIRARLEKLSATHTTFAGAKANAEVAQRAERTVLGLERLLVSLKWNKHPALNPKLDELFRDVQSRPDFSPTVFAGHLKSFSAELAKLP